MLLPVINHQNRDMFKIYKTKTKQTPPQLEPTNSVTEGSLLGELSLPTFHPGGSGPGPPSPVSG